MPDSSDSRRILALLAALAWVAARPASAEEPRLAVVLPLDVSNAGELDRATQVALDEVIRTVSGENLSSIGYTVLSSETTLSLMADNGIDAAKACEASCALQTARELKAKVLASGTLTRTEGTYVANVRLFESATGRQLGSLILEGGTVRELRQAFIAKAPEFFARLKDTRAPAPEAAVKPPVEPSAAPWLVAAGSLVAAAAGGYFGYAASRDMATRESALSTAAFDAAGRDASSNALSANVLFGVGGVGAVVSVLLFLSDRAPAAPSAAPAAVSTRF